MLGPEPAFGTGGVGSFGLHWGRNMKRQSNRSRVARCARIVIRGLLRSEQASKKVSGIMT